MIYDPNPAKGRRYPWRYHHASVCEARRHEPHREHAIFWDRLADCEVWCIGTLDVEEEHPMTRYTHFYLEPRGDGSIIVTDADGDEVQIPPGHGRDVMAHGGAIIVLHVAEPVTEPPAPDSWGDFAASLSPVRNLLAIVPESPVIQDGYIDANDEWVVGRVPQGIKYGEHRWGAYA